SPFFWQWEHPSLVVGTYTASGNSLLAVGMPCAFYSQHRIFVAREDEFVGFGVVSAIGVDAVDD
nr:hypothetical protein [Tanacetum cinerariifolium]